MEVREKKTYYLLKETIEDVHRISFLMKMSMSKVVQEAVDFYKLHKVNHSAMSKMREISKDDVQVCEGVDR